MARYTKAEENTSTGEELDEALASLTDKQLAFWQHMNTGKMTQVEAYRRAFDVSPDTNDNVVQVNASRLWNSTKFSLCRRLLANTVREQSARTLEYRIAEMEAFAERAEAAGQYGAAFQARQAAGKLEGQYVEKKEITQRNRKEELEILKAIAQDGSQAAIEYAMKEAKELGLQKELSDALGIEGTVH